MPRYLRNASGRTIHLADCTYAKGWSQFMHPWEWAEGKPRRYLADLCEGFGYRACWKCKPFQE